MARTDADGRGDGDDDPGGPMLRDRPSEEASGMRGLVERSMSPHDGGDGLEQVVRTVSILRQIDLLSHGRRM